ncbi:hypothetical protein ACFYNO_11650 [Kitasatospora sp. NPDC006697]|uniref:hypothetical protein n=1 Tax=Kitasatospora sp. NPDC006697 TaxID=3364020 RepID=UPI003685FB7E
MSAPSAAPAPWASEHEPHEPLVVELEDGTVLTGPDRAALGRALDLLAGEGNQFLAIGRFRTAPEEYIQVYRHAAEGWQVEYRDGSAERHFQAVGHQSRRRTEQLLWGWVSAAPGWREAADWVRLEPAELLPDARLVRIRHRPGGRTEAVGWYREGQFLAGRHPLPGGPEELVMLHLFDAEGQHTGTRLQPAGGPGEAARLLGELLAALPEPEAGDIAVQPFRIEVRGAEWGLLDRAAEHGGTEWYELVPQRMGFHAPWDGRYEG